MTNPTRLLLVLGLVLVTASDGYGEEPRSGPAVKSSPQARKALAESIPRREMELALRDRKDVLTEVEQRMQEMSVSASADELTDLLERRASLQIGLDKCQVGSIKGGECDAMKAEMAAVETSFREKTGLSTREFRGGRRDATERDAARAARAGTPRATTAASAGDSCTCALSVYSDDRWMNRYWGLECNNHASHGFCSNNVDSSHSPGTGAMTGDINLYMGSYHQYKECPDDHVTCFHGPSTAHSGQWGNCCNCDTWHSQYWNPNGDWYGGDLSDSLWVHQVSTPYFTVAGSCDGAYVTVSEYIKENDPICCDDPMGTLWVSVRSPTAPATARGKPRWRTATAARRAAPTPTAVPLERRSGSPTSARPTPRPRRRSAIPKRSRIAMPWAGTGNPGTATAWTRANPIPIARSGTPSTATAIATEMPLREVSDT